MSGVSRKTGGDLRRLRERLRSVADGQAFQKLKMGLLEELTEQVAHGFKTGRSPDGYSVWKPSWRSRHDGGQPLSDTRRLLNSITGQGADGFARTTPTGLEIGSNLIYASVHNEGAVIKAKNGRGLRFTVSAFTNVGARGKVLKRPRRIGDKTIVVQKVTIPKRQFLPDEGTLPEPWREAFNDAARTVLDALLKKKR